MKTIYMDNSATSRVLPEVLDAMRPVMLESYGNASSLHHKGREAREILEVAREKLANLIGADSPSEIIFTSGGTEADNLALIGVVSASAKKGKKRIVVSKIEHNAVLHVCSGFIKDFCSVEYAPVGDDGVVDISEFEKLLDDSTAVASVMMANNETGVLQPVHELANLCHKKGVKFHTDAVQAAGKIPVRVNDIGADLLSISSHKFHGPKGVGALYLRKGTKLQKTSFGGHHERNLRAGTENVPGIVGMVKALEISVEKMKERARITSTLRDLLETKISEQVGDIIIHGRTAPRLPNISNISFRFVEGESIILRLDELGICVSSGSACTSDTLEPSHVLSAMGVPIPDCHGSIRFSLSEDNTEDEVVFVAETIRNVVDKLRNMSPLYNKK